MKSIRRILLIKPSYLSLKSTRTISQYQNFIQKDTGELYDQHIKTSSFQKGILTIGSALAALNNPHRGDMVAALGETSGHSTLQNLRLKMLNNDTGFKILTEKPILDSNVLNVEQLLQYPQNSLGYYYAHFMHSQNLSSDTRDPVRFVDNTELAYIMKRYRQIHDFCHVMLGFSVGVPAELVVKWFEWFHFGFPMTGLSSIFGPLAVSWDEQSQIRSYIPWAAYTGTSSKLFLNVYFEELLENDIHELRMELGIHKPPDGILHDYW